MIPIAHIDQVLFASPSYLNQRALISRPEDSKHHEFISLTMLKNFRQLNFRHIRTLENVEVELDSRLSTNNLLVSKSLCVQGHGLARILYSDIQKNLLNGSLVEILPESKLPAFTLYAIISKHEQQPMKVQRCLEALKQYFFNC